MTDETPSARTQLDALAERVERGREAAGLNPQPSKVAAARDAGDGLRIAIEFVVSVLVGAGLGYVLGDAAGAKVIGLLLGMLVGFAAGVRSAYKVGMAAVARQSDNKEDAGNARQDD